MLDLMNFLVNILAVTNVISGNGGRNNVTDNSSSSSGTSNNNNVDADKTD